MSKNKLFATKLDVNKPFPKRYQIGFWLSVFCIVFGFCTIAVGVIFENAVITETLSMFLSLLILVGAISLQIIIIIYVVWRVKKFVYNFKEISRKEKEAADEAARQAREAARLAEEAHIKKKKEKEQMRRAQISKGTWPFPDVRLYELCEKNGIRSLDSSFARQKAYSLAKKILNESNIDEQYHEIYIGSKAEFGGDILNERFENGLKLLEEINRTPVDGELNKEQTEYQGVAHSVKMLYGVNKRNAMLDDLINKLKGKIRKYEEGREAMLKVGILMASSVTQESKKDWATLGGIADGLAGPGAGFAVASAAMRENEAIEERNRRARESGSKMLLDMYSHANSLNGEISDMKRALSKLEGYRKATESKVVMSEYSTEEIYKKLYVKSRTVRRSDGGKCSELELVVKNNFVADIPDGVAVAVDGTIDAEIFFGRTLVDRICVPLPLFGIRQGESEKLLAYSSKYVKADGEYTVKLHPNKLWIVEI